MENKVQGLTALSDLIDRMIVDIHASKDAPHVHGIVSVTSEERVKYAVHQWHVRGSEEPEEDEELIAYLDEHMMYSYEMARFNMSMITAEAARYNCVPYAFSVNGSRSFSYVIEGTEASVGLFLQRWYAVPDLSQRPLSGITEYRVRRLDDLRKKRSEARKKIGAFR